MTFLDNEINYKEILSRLKKMMVSSWPCKKITLILYLFLLKRYLEIYLK